MTSPASSVDERMMSAFSPESCATVDRLTPIVLLLIDQMRRREAHLRHGIFRISGDRAKRASFIQALDQYAFTSFFLSDFFKKKIQN